MNEKRTKCPVCKVIYWDRAIKVHIINAAKAETWKVMNSFLNGWLPHLDPDEVEKMKHTKFWRKNQKQINKFIL